MLRHPIELLQLNKKKENQFLSKGLSTVEDIAYYFPRKYIDFRTITSAKDVVPGNYYAMAGIVESVHISGKSCTAVVRETVEIVKDYFPRFQVVWFGTDCYARQLIQGTRYIFCGRVSEYRGMLQINTPLAFGQDESKLCIIMPVYSKIPGMATQYLNEQIRASVGFLLAKERVGEKDLFADVLKLMPKYEAIQEIHCPTNAEMFRQAKRRMAFEDIYDFYADLKRKDLYQVGISIQAMQQDFITRQTISGLPFALTKDQENVMDVIIREVKSGHRLHSLVSGDVGCGKTMIAVLSSILMWENGYQTILMAPTLVLAQQHYQGLQKYAQALGVRVGMLTTETKKRERSRLLADFAAGTLHVLIGTHAVLSSSIVPYRLGLTVIDEEHKFGVQQKAKLEEYDKAGAHHLSMTATPIPRSVAMAVYGRDLAVLPIRTMPKGRKPIQTKQCFVPEDAFEIMYQEVLKGHQGYLICPFIEDSDSPRCQNVMSIATAKKLAEDFFDTRSNNVRLGVITGDMKQKEILQTVQSFTDHEIDILLSTTIVEVGVHVPNATAITIMSADRFGLAALHQLRGRVGRSSDQGFCLLCSDVRTERLDIMCRTADGFTIAEEDLRLRGPGDLTGDAQSGSSDVFELIRKRPNLTRAIKNRFFPEITAS